jgi:hypothetical protein
MGMLPLRLAIAPSEGQLERAAGVGCVNRISLQTGQIRTADEFTQPNPEPDTG